MVTKAKKETTAVVNWEAKMAAYAKAATEQVDTLTSGSNFISFKSGVISYAGNPVAENRLQAVIVDSVLENCFYDTPYNEDEPSPPVCYAFGRDAKTMVPHEDSPKKQAESCAECEHNKFGSAENGKGKACANRVRIALLPAEPLSEDSLKKSEIAIAKLPVMSGGNLASYVRTLAGLQKRPPMGVVTEIGTVPDTKSTFRVTFNHKLNLKNELLGAVDGRMEEAGTALTAPYPEPAEEAPKAAPAKGKAAAKGKVPPAKGRKY